MFPLPKLDHRLDARLIFRIVHDIRVKELLGVHGNGDQDSAIVSAERFTETVLALLR
jgi:hypothetical protein